MKVQTRIKKALTRESAKALVNAIDRIDSVRGKKVLMVVTKKGIVPMTVTSEGLKTLLQAAGRKGIE